MSQPRATYHLLSCVPLNEILDRCRVEISLDPSFNGFTHATITVDVNAASRDAGVRAYVRKKILQDAGMDYQEADLEHLPDECKLYDAEPEVIDESPVESEPVVQSDSVIEADAEPGPAVPPVHGRKKKGKRGR